LEIQLMSTFNKAAVFAVFAAADKSSASFAEQLLALGVGDRATARPLAMQWALAKAQSKNLDAGVKLIKGQRGLTFSKRDTAAERMTNRVLDVCFPKADMPAKLPKINAARAADPVEKLLADFAKLTAGQKRSFKAKLA
jgi:hypothetical protein